MAFVPGKNTAISLDNDAGTLTAITSYVSQISGWGNSVEQLDATVFGRNSKESIPGLRNGDTVTLTCKWDATLHAHIIALLDNDTSSTLRYSPDGTASGKPNMSVEVFVAGYAVDSAVGDLVTAAVQLRQTGDVTFGTH